MVAQASAASSKPKIKLASHADICVVDSNHLVFMTIIEQLMSTVMIQTARSSRSDQNPCHSSKEPVYDSTAISYLLAYNTADMENDILFNCIVSPDPDQHSTDRQGQKTIKITYYLS